MRLRGTLERVAAAAAVLWTLGLLRLTLQGLAGGAWGSRWVVAGPEEALADVVANLVAFAPLGAMLVGAGKSVSTATRVAFALSAAIEVTQGFAVPGRYAAVSDLLANTAGGCLGAWLAAQASQLVFPARRQAWQLAVTWAAAVAVALAGTTYLMQPGAPSAQYEGQHSEDWHVARQDAHAVQHAWFNGRQFEWGPLVDPARASRALAEDRLRLEILLDPGEGPFALRRLAAVIGSDESHEILARLATARGDVRFSSRVRATSWGLHPPFVRLESVIPPKSPIPRPPLQLGGAREAGLLAVWVRGPTGEVRRASLRLTPIDGWMLVAPPVLVVRVGTVVARALAALLYFGPLAWWMAVALGWARRKTAPA